MTDRQTDSVVPLAAHPPRKWPPAQASGTQSRTAPGDEGSDRQRPLGENPEHTKQGQQQHATTNTRSTHDGATVEFSPFPVDTEARTCELYPVSNTRTTLCGAVAAAAGALAALPDLPRNVHLTCVAVASVSVALLGFFAADTTPTAKLKGPLVLLIAGLTIVAAATGCAVTGLKLNASNPAWGTIELSIGGGSIGNHTNPPTAITITNKPP